jgi:hypothetical protein
MTHLSKKLHYATTWKAVGSILNAIGFLNRPKPISHTMAPGLTQPLTEMNTRNSPGERGSWPVCKAEKAHHHLWADCPENVKASTYHKCMGFHSLLEG